MIQSAKTLAARFWNDETGASMMEYTILIALVSLALVVTIGAVSGQLLVRWNDLQAALTPAP